MMENAALTKEELLRASFLHTVIFFSSDMSHAADGIKGKWYKTRTKSSR